MNQHEQHVQIEADLAREVEKRHETAKRNRRERDAFLRAWGFTVLSRPAKGESWWQRKEQHEGRWVMLAYLEREAVRIAEKELREYSR